jgi:catechol 2,3-dioxygenase-like lactoylglutathione lyase family enzyme
MIRPGIPLLAITLTLTSTAFFADASDTGEAGTATTVGCVGMTVSDVERLSDFYSKTLSFQKVTEFETAGAAYETLEGVFGMRTRTARMKLGGECIELTEYMAPKGRAVPVDSRSNDGWFQHVAIVVSDMDKAYQGLRAARVEYASTDPQTLPVWNRNAAGIRAFYFKDPDHHTLEVIQFPNGKGDPRWQKPSTSGSSIFLGIDHTAIVVKNTDASLRFYRDSLGLRVAGESENWGTEQEHLNNVFGAHLRITTLRAPQGGPGIELLEYLTPRDGRPIPDDARANDLAHWQTVIVSRDLDTQARALRSAHYPTISPVPVSLSEPRLGFSRAFLARDVDGHAIELVAR